MNISRHDVRALGLLFVGLGAWGCSPVAGSDDAGEAGRDDAGSVTPEDAAIDAGAAPDAGEGEPDAGAGAPDGGTTPPPALVVDARFDDGLPGEPCSGADGFGSAFSRSVRDDTHAFDGETSCRLGIGEGQQGFGVFGGLLSSRVGELARGDEIWLRVSLYVPSDWEFNEGRSKFLRIRTFHPDGGESHGYLDWYLATRHEQPHAWIYEGHHNWRTFGEAEHGVVRDTWEHYEIYYYLDHVPVSEGGEGRVRVWKNDELLTEITDQPTLVHEDDVARGINVFTWFGNEGAPRDQSLWIDRLQVAIEEPSGRDAHGHPFIGLF